MNFLRVIADGVSTGLSSSGIVSKYKLGSSANVDAITKVMIEKDFIQDTENGIVLTNPVFGIWLKEN